MTIPTTSSNGSDAGDDNAAGLGLVRRHGALGSRRISYLFREGSRRLALIPGSFQDYRQWLEVINGLDRTLGLVVVELPGHDESDKWQGDPSIEQFALDAWNVLDACGFGEEVYVGGHSIGGMIALEMGRVRPAAVSGIISVEGWTSLRACEDSGFAERMYNTLSPELLARQNDLRALAGGRLTEEDRRAFAQAWTRWDGAAFLQSTHIPILELWGDRGRARPTLEQLHIPDRPNITVKWFENASHNLPLERPLEVARAIMEFIEEYHAH